MCKYKIQDSSDALAATTRLAVFLREMKLFCTLVALGTVLLGPTAVFAQDGLEDSILTALRLVTDMSYATQEYVSRLSISNMPAEGPVREELPRVSNVSHRNHALTDQSRKSCKPWATSATRSLWRFPS